MSEEHITEIRDAGYLPSSEVPSARSPIVTRVGGKYSVRVPRPHAGEQVIFIYHLLRGLCFPIHPFPRVSSTSMTSNFIISHATLFYI